MNNEALHRFYELVAENELEKAFEELEKLIEVEVPLLMIDLTVLRRRFKAAGDDHRLGTLSPMDYKVEISKITRDFLYIVQQLPTDEEKRPTGLEDGRTSGKLLYDIPSRFPLGRLTKCVIRLADSEEALVTDFTVSPDTIIEEVPIEKVMAVELIDIEEGRNFDIKALNSSAQQLLPALATQWVYYVKALTEGEHLLVLRVSTVEMIDGVERPKEVLFERQVMVEAAVEPRQPSAQRQWQPTNLVIAGNLGPQPSPPIVGGSIKKTPFEGWPEGPPPAASRSRIPAPAPLTEDRTEDRPRRKTGVPWAKMAAAILVVVVAGWWITSQREFSISDGEMTNPTRNPYDVNDSEETADPDKIEIPDNNQVNMDLKSRIPPEWYVGRYRYNRQTIAISQSNGWIQWQSGEQKMKLSISGSILFNAETGRKYRLQLDDAGQAVTGFISTSDPEEIWIKQD